MTELTVTSEAVALAVEQSGEGTAVVLLHGLTATRRYVVMGSRVLARSGHRVISYDARGHGVSSPAASSDAYDYRALTGDLGAVLDHLGVHRAVLTGASMGAHTALRFASDAPERVAGLVLVTPAYDPATHEDPARLARWDELAHGLRAGGVEGFIAAYGPPRVPAPWAENVATVLRQRLSAHHHPQAVADALRVVPRSRPFARWEDVAGVDVPTVVVASRDEADPGHPLALAEQYAAVLPEAHLVCEQPGRSPLAWQGAQLSRVIAELASRVG